jgi:hypothetical protein
MVGGHVVVSPVELSKLGLRERLNRLGYLRYIVIIGMIFLVMAGIEVFRYTRYITCFSHESLTIYFSDQELQNLTKQFNTVMAKDPKSPYSDFLIEAMEKRMFRNMATARHNCSSFYDVFRWISWLGPITVANAQTGPPVDDANMRLVRTIFIAVIFACICVFFFVSVATLLISKNPKVLAFVMDSLKMMLGFFLGVMMTFMGVHP